MELTAFRVQNFRSINDSSWIEVGRRTVLVGRNESGKSSLLKSLHALKGPGGVLGKFTFARDFPRDRPRKNFQAKLTVLETKWKLNAADRTALGAVWLRGSSVTEVLVERTYEDANRYVSFIGAKGLADLSKEVTESFKRVAKSVRAAWKKTAPDSEELNPVLVALESAINGEFEEPDWSNHVTAAMTALKESMTAAAVPMEPDVAAAVKDIEQKVASVKNDDAQHATARKWVAQHLPIFVYVDEWDFLSGHESIDQYLKNSENGALTKENINFAKLLKVAELDAKELKDLLTQNHEERTLLTDRAGRVVTKTLRELWKDREITVQFRVDAGHFDVLVSDKDTDALVPLDERSRGFRWYFSFYISYAADTQGGDMTNAVLLLDEPGLFLHATAQSSLLRFFDKLPNQIIYSTHSPFMIDPARLENVRTVNLKETGGTTVSSDPTGDANTLFPLQAALGYTLTQTLFIGARNVVVEGVTDYWYLTTASEYLKGKGRTGLRDDATLTPAGGAQKVSYMVTLLTAQELRVVVLLDSEPQAENTKKELLTAKLIRSDSVLHVGQAWATPPSGGADIEDILDPDVYTELARESHTTELAGKAPSFNSKIPRVTYRVADAFKAAGVEFNKTRVASLFIRRMATDPDKLMAGGAADRFEQLFSLLNAAVEKADKAEREPFR